MHVQANCFVPENIYQDPVPLWCLAFAVSFFFVGGGGEGQREGCWLIFSQELYTVILLQI